MTCTFICIFGLFSVFIPAKLKFTLKSYTWFLFSKLISPPGKMLVSIIKAGKQTAGKDIDDTRNIWENKEKELISWLMKRKF